MVHHAALGSLAWVHLDDLEELDRARGTLAALSGVEAVLDRSAAAEAFELPADRIGDLIVLADATTVLGKSAAAHDLSALHGALRSHGGLHERSVPLIVTHPLRAGALRGRDLRNRDLHDLLLNAVALTTTTASTLPVHSPYTGGLVGEAPVASAEQLNRALDAGAAYADELSRHERSRVLFGVADALAGRRDELAALITAESGLCLKDTRHEVGAAVDVFRFAAIEALHDDGETFAGDVSPHGRPRRAHTMTVRSGWSPRSPRSTSPDQPGLAQAGAGDRGRRADRAQALGAGALARCA